MGSQVSSEEMSVRAGQGSDEVLVSQAVWDYLAAAGRRWLLDFEEKQGLSVAMVRRGERGGCCAVRLQPLAEGSSGSSNSSHRGRAARGVEQGAVISPATRKAFIDLCRSARKEMTKAEGAQKRKRSLLPCVGGLELEPGEGTLLSSPPPPPTPPPPGPPLSRRSQRQQQQRSRRSGDVVACLGCLGPHEAPTPAPTVPTPHPHHPHPHPHPRTEVQVRAELVASRMVGAPTAALGIGGSKEEMSTTATINSITTSSSTTPSICSGISSSSCPICMGEMVDRTTLERCGHTFCRVCLEQAFLVKRACPVCRLVYGQLIGNQPANGTMMVERDPDAELPGHEGYGCICIVYSFPPGLQAEEHPNPGVRYPGTDRVAYLPDSPEGNRVLGLLRRAFEQRLIFTVGTSMTTGMHNVITWNDIHHKTSIWGGPRCFGYPDPTYLVRVTEELREKGITAD
ncbi:probable E3 ubiquitin-protein ligase DTX3 isoform X2 [Engraulis encrasicolus]|uniref:probable E3 ubiquitin-protein ligase DTX3 isoform X2 n=1 Tax=Engraulis encrasicolus TaxID=184585 RepID=UPI002FD0B248